MPNNKDDKKSGSPGREFQDQGKNKSSGMGDQKAGSHKRSMADSSMEDADMNTAGGRKGNFSDKGRGSEDQWSPGSTGASDQ